jgi:hypothetical protein
LETVVNLYYRNLTENLSFTCYCLSFGLTWVVIPCSGEDVKLILQLKYLGFHILSYYYSTNKASSISSKIR